MVQSQQEPPAGGKKYFPAQIEFPLGYKFWEIDSKNDITVFSLLSVSVSFILYLRPMDQFQIYLIFFLSFI